MNNSRNPKTLSFILEETLKDQRGIFFIDKCLSDTFKIHYNNILAGSNTVQGSNISIIQLYRESGIELLILNSPLVIFMNKARPCHKLNRSRSSLDASETALFKKYCFWERFRNLPSLFQK